MITLSVPKSNIRTIQWQKLIYLFVLLVTWDGVATGKILLSREPAAKTIEISYGLTQAKIRLQRDLVDFKTINRDFSAFPVDEQQSFLGRLSTPTNLIELTDDVLDYSKTNHAEAYDTLKYSLISNICDSGSNQSYGPCPSLL